jgi:hypothetical protein
LHKRCFVFHGFLLSPPNQLAFARYGGCRGN